METKTVKTAEEKMAQTLSFIIRKVQEEIDQAEAKNEQFKDRFDKDGAWDAIRWRADIVGEAVAVLGPGGVKWVTEAELWGDTLESTVVVLRQWLDFAIDRHLGWSEGGSTCQFTNELNRFRHMQEGRTIRGIKWAVERGEKELGEAAGTE